MKQVSWNSASPELLQPGIPTQFETTSRIAIIGNSWRELTVNVQAIEDRAHVILFNPSAETVHRAAVPWFTDQEIFDFIGGHLRLYSNHSFRTYVRALELKNAGLDWQHGALADAISGVTLEVARLEADFRFDSVDARIAEFIARTGKSRATYYNHARRLGRTAGPAGLVLPNSRLRVAHVERPRRVLLRNRPEERARTA